MRLPCGLPVFSRQYRVLHQLADHFLNTTTQAPQQGHINGSTHASPASSLLKIYGDLSHKRMRAFGKHLSYFQEGTFATPRKGPSVDFRFSIEVPNHTPTNWKQFPWHHGKLGAFCKFSLQKWYRTKLQKSGTISTAFPQK